MKYLLSGILLLCSLFVSAQPGDLTQDREYFEKQAKLYQRWLENSGLSSFLSVREIDVKPDRLSLYLEFPYQSTDSVFHAWHILKASFEENHAITLEQQLFYKMVHLMEIRQDLADVQIYDTYDLRRTSFFMRAIYFDDGKVKVQTNIPRDPVREIVLQAPDTDQGKDASVLSFQQRCQKKIVYDQILAFARKKYRNTKCEDRTPRLDVLESEEVLRFEVSNLCREVLIDESQPTVCKILRSIGYPCDWAKRELLIFTITYSPSPEGVQVTISIEGKYGSGFYDNVRRGAYLDMEIDFDEYLERYADLFKRDLSKHLSCP